MGKLKIIKHGVFQNLRSAFQDAIQMASANVCWQSGTEFLLEVSTYCQLKVCKKSYKNIKRAHCESLKDLLFKIESLLRFETLWVVYFSKIYNFDRWRIGLKGFPGVAGSNHCNVLFNGYRWDITWFNSIGKFKERHGFIIWSAFSHEVAFVEISDLLLLARYHARIVPLRPTWRAFV